MAVDPVCGMKVDEDQAAAKAEHQGRIYYFCSHGCHQAFTAEPQKYLGPGGQPHGGGRQR